MTKDLGRYVGSKYLGSLGYSFLELTEMMDQDLKVAASNKELPRGIYYVKFFESPAGDSIDVDCNLKDYYDMDQLELGETKENVLDIIGKYNRVTHSNGLDEKDRRFYNETVNLF